MGLLNFILKYAHFLILAWGAFNCYDIVEKSKATKIDLENKKEDIRGKMKASKKTLDEIEEFKKDLEMSKERVKEVSKQIKEVQRKLPNTISDTEILSMYSEELQGLNLQNIQLTPKSEDNKGWYFSKSFELGARGTFLQILVFFERLQEKSRIFNMVDLNLRHTSGRQKGRFQLLDVKTHVETFRYNPAYRPMKEIKKADEKVENKEKVVNKRKNKKR